MNWMRKVVMSSWKIDDKTGLYYKPLDMKLKHVNKPLYLPLTLNLSMYTSFPVRSINRASGITALQALFTCPLMLSAVATEVFRYIIRCVTAIEGIWLWSNLPIGSAFRNVFHVADPSVEIRTTVCVVGEGLANGMFFYFKYWRAADLVKGVILIVSTACLRSMDNWP